MTDPVKEYGRHVTAVRNLNKRIDRRIAALEEERKRALFELNQELSPAAARIKVAAETEIPVVAESPRPLATENNEAGLFVYPEEVSLPDPNPAPAWLNVAPPELPPGALLEVPERKAKRA